MMKTQKKRERGTAYMLDHIPPDLYKAVRARCLKEGRTVRFVMLTLLTVYAAKGLDALER